MKVVRILVLFSGTSVIHRLLCAALYVRKFHCSRACGWFIPPHACPCSSCPPPHKVRPISGSVNVYSFVSWRIGFMIGCGIPCSGHLMSLGADLTKRKISFIHVVHIKNANYGNAVKMVFLALLSCLKTKNYSKGSSKTQNTLQPRNNRKSVIRSGRDLRPEKQWCCST